MAERPLQPVLLALFQKKTDLYRDNGQEHTSTDND